MSLLVGLIRAKANRVCVDVGGTSRAPSAAGNTQLVAQLRAQLEEMTVQCQSLEKERDFYFDKVRKGVRAFVCGHG